MSDFFQNVISACFGEEIQLISASAVPGGCINNTYRLHTSRGVLFLKWNTSEYVDMFECEVKGLSLLSSYSNIHTPRVIGCGQIANKSYLLLDWIESGRQKKVFWDEFGTSLAHMHKSSQKGFGLDHNNYIGRLLQRNKEHNTWYDFFREERLKPQIQLAKTKNLIDSSLENKFEVLYGKLGSLVPKEEPSFLHGDLWSGNFMVDSSGAPAFFDPAVHYGHRETEIAFTTLFGGFSEEFYHSYNEALPLEPDFEERIPIHNLYPLLVHVNLFGASYLSGIVQTLNRLV